MDTIIEPNNLFDFTKLSLAVPVGLQGSAYFTKIEYNKKPLYIQTDKIQTKQGFVKSGKKYYCDLMFDKNSENLIHWFENLEETCQKLIFEKRETWFENNLEESDIESAFNSTIRIYKSGKFYLLRTNIKNNHQNLPSIKIYNEQQLPLTMEDITSETNLITILEIQGIKFTSRNFQIEIELKQAMVMDNEPLFDNCLIKPNKKIAEENITLANNIKNHDQTNFSIYPSLLEKENKSNNITSLDELNHPVDELNDPVDEFNHITIDELNDPVDELNDPVDEFNGPIHELNGPVDEFNDNVHEKDIFIKTDTCNKDNVVNDSLVLEFEDLDKDIEEEEKDDLKEISHSRLPLENLEIIQLKKPNQVYFDLYKEARSRAKQAKKTAILAYLEAKNIKKTYMIENINDSDSDFDAEIDEVSESELDNL
jgi:hypothetical protein